MLKRVMTTNRFSAEFWPDDDMTKRIVIPNNEIVISLNEACYNQYVHTQREICFWNGMIGSVMPNSLLTLPDISWEQNDNARI